MPPNAATRRDALAQFLALALVALLATLPFWLTDLDLRIARLFYHPELEDPWFLGRQLPWSLLYDAVPFIVGLILVGGLGILVAAWFKPGCRRHRRAAILVLGTLVLGPGLLVNAIFKEHWGRPRPQQVETLGGTQAYLPPLKRGEAGGGRAFPSGHSSVGFLLGVFFLIWRRRRPRLAWAALGGSLLLGALIGVARMAAGGHFLSDVLWSLAMTLGAAWLLHYWILRPTGPP